MRTKASTAALDPFSQRPLLLRRRVPRHPASGQELQGSGSKQRRDLNGQGNDREDGDKNYKRGVHRKAGKELLQANSCHRAAHGWRAGCASDCFDDARAAQ